MKLFLLTLLALCLVFVKTEDDEAADLDVEEAEAADVDELLGPVVADVSSEERDITGSGEGEGES